MEPVLFFDWSVYLGQYFNVSEKPGAVLLKEYVSDNGHDINVMNKCFPVFNASQ